jgi:hypothetical protein
MNVCHCSMCRKWTGGVFMSVHCDSVEITEAAALGVYTSSEWAERLFCQTCGTSLFWRMPGKSAAAVSLAAFDDASAFAFTEEIFIDEKPALYAFANETEKKTGPEVMAAFAAQGNA